MYIDCESEYSFISAIKQTREALRKINSSVPLHSFLLAQPRQRTLTTLGDRTFAVAAPMLWNCVPVELRNPNISIESCKVKLKTHLFREAYR